MKICVCLLLTVFSLSVFPFTYSWNKLGRRFYSVHDNGPNKKVDMNSTKLNTVGPVTPQETEAFNLVNQ